MTTQAITDIKELVGEMPARGCEYLEDGSPQCDSSARWAMRVHFIDGPECRITVQNLCDQHKCELVDLAARYAGVPCRSCGVAADALFGPVMPL